MNDVSPLRRASGRLRFRAVDRAAQAVARVLEMDGEEAGRIFTRFDAARIMAAAAAVDAAPELLEGPLAGLLVSIKDLFDEAGETTAAGSLHFRDAPAAATDAVAVARLKAAGAVPFGRTAMSEFAYSGVGLNPHFGTPGNSRDPARIPGGSTSGGALSVALGLADVALGSDTGGSVRIPAAFNALAGFKPTQAKVPLDGAFALSGTYDSIGPLARDIRTCAAVHAVLSGEARPQRTVREAGSLRVGVVRSVLAETVDDQVAADFDLALDALRRAGVDLVDVDIPQLADAGAANRVIVAADAHRIHEGHLDALEIVGDPRVLKRIRAAEGFAEGEEAGARARRAAAVTAFGDIARGFDAFVAPTVAVVPPAIEAVEADFDRLNALVLRNPSAVNFLDGCAATVPMSAATDLPTGLMIFGPGGSDWTVLAVAALFEPLVKRR
ncbi:MAG TPA: amidase family protein [Arenibaculum sp.]|nr:amidase family protein [Arenibaculum sp.]